MYLYLYLYFPFPRPLLILMAIWEGARAFLQNVQIDLGTVGRSSHTQNSCFPKMSFVCSAADFRGFKICSMLFCFFHIMEWALLGNSYKLSSKSLRAKKAFWWIYYLSGKSRSGREEENQWSSELHVEIDYSGQVPPADVSYVPKRERISHDIHHHKKKLITSRKIDLPTREICFKVKIASASHWTILWGVDCSKES